MAGMSTNTKRWPTNPPPEPEPGATAPELEGLEDGPFDPSPVQASSPAQRVVAAKESAHAPRPPDGQSLRYSPILWISLITLAILGLSGAILWHEWRYPRPAPMATRTAISFCRPTALASSRLATFAHAINSTIVTAPSSINNAGRTFCTS